MHESEIEALALDALGLVRNELLVSLRFMSAAFARLAPLPIPGATLATDGAHLRFDPVTWARTYANDPAEASRAYLHTVLHNVFLHLYPGAGIDPLLWDIACDMVVESVIDQLDLPATRTAQAAAFASRAGAHGRRGRPHDCRARLRCPARSTRRRRN